MYQDQPLFNEVDSFMRERGFHLFDLKLFYWRRKSGLGFDGNRRGQLVHGDALYFRNTEKYFNVLENSGFYIRERLLKSVAIALFFGYTDYAISILEKAMNRKAISFDEYSQLSKNIKRKEGENLSLYNFKGKQLLHDFFSRLLDSNYNGWSKINKKKLGN